MTQRVRGREKDREEGKRQKRGTTGLVRTTEIQTTVNLLLKSDDIFGNKDAGNVIFKWQFKVKRNVIIINNNNEIELSN